jgi:hypothetical protein
MILFKRPEWLKPEINNPKYYLHLLILAAVLLGILQLWQGGQMFNIRNVAITVGMLLLGDVVAHSLLKMS